MKSHTSSDGKSSKLWIQGWSNLLSMAMVAALLFLSIIGCKMLNLGDSPLDNTTWNGRDSATGVTGLTFTLRPGGKADCNMVIPGKPPLPMTGTWTSSGDSVTMLFGPITVNATVSGNQMTGTMGGKESPPFQFTAAKQGTGSGTVPDTGQPTSPVSGAGDTRSCSDENGLRSPQTNETADMTFTNSTSSSVTVYWLDYEGNRKKYFDLEAGRTQTQSTYRGHWWIVTGSSGQCRLIAAAPQSVKIAP